ncbi:helix-turn-helix transcriptional regulator [Litoribacillus peritrichatus]|uniref:Helix-turn-helix transcriptional regulator n=1 Tax=Litoribacillus peritrichatus TaxID=718191 RepID=A0ABP7NBW4_9GAMM
MAQVQLVVKTLKRLLKQQGLNYKDVADAIGLSEASVKRIFSEGSFSLDRLDAICGLMELELSDLFSEVKKQQHRISQLTEDQEKQLVANEGLFIVANSVLNRWDFETIQAVYQFTDHELIQHLAQLDRLKLIELQPGNRIKLIVDRNFNWIKYGPIQRFFEQRMQAEFLQSRFNQPGEKRVFVNGMISRSSNRLLQEKIIRLVDEFNERHSIDEELPIEERFGSSMLIAIRHWEPEFFEKKRNRPDTRRF